LAISYEAICQVFNGSIGFHKPEERARCRRFVSWLELLINGQVTFAKFFDNLVEVMNAVLAGAVSVWPNPPAEL
jgi:hypothetical protein